MGARRLPMHPQASSPRFVTSPQLPSPSTCILIDYIWYTVLRSSSVFVQWTGFPKEAAPHKFTAMSGHSFLAAAPLPLSLRLMRINLNNTQSESIGYTVFASGDSEFFRAASILLAECLKTAFVDDDSPVLTTELPKFLSVDSRPKADGGVVLAGIVGVFAFLTTWFAKKLLDDVYEIKLRPSIREALGAADVKLDGANAAKPKMLMVGISYSDRQIFILIGVVGDTFEEILASERIIPMVHANAVQWAEKNPSNLPVHLYIVDRGTTNIEPMLYKDLASVHRSIANLERSEGQT